MEKFQTFITILQTVLVPIAVAVIGYFGVRYQKRTAKEKELRDQVEEAERKINTETMNRIENSINGVSKRIDGISETVDSLKTETDKQRDEIDKLFKFSKHNAEHSKYTSDIITAMAEGLRDNNINGGVTAAVNAYREFESGIITSIYDKDED